MDLNPEEKKERMKKAREFLVAEEARRKAILEKILTAHGWIINPKIVSEFMAVIEDFEKAISEEEA